MDNLRYGGVNRRPSPQLPAFCRTRRPITTTVQVSALQQLLWLLWVVLALQLSTILLILAGPVPAQLRPGAARQGISLKAAQHATSREMPSGDFPARAIALPHGASITTVPSTLQP